MYILHILNYELGNYLEILPLLLMRMMHVS